MARFGQGLIQALTNPSYQQGMFNLGSAIGSAPAVRREQEVKKAREAEVQQLLSTYASDPQKLTSYAQNMAIQGQPELASVFENAAEQANIAKMQKNLATAAEALGLPDLATQARTTTDPVMLRELAKTLGQERIKRTPTQSLQARRSMAQAAGITPSQFSSMKMATMSDTDFTNIVEGQKGTLKAWTDKENKVNVYRQNEFGRVYDNETKTWVDPIDLGITEAAPQVQKIEETYRGLKDELVKEGVKSYSELTDQAKLAQSVLDNIEQVRPLLEQGVFGVGANQVLFLKRVGSAIGLPFDEDVVSTEQYIALAAPRIAARIKDFGAGTGLSDKDREFSEKAEAGNITMNEESLRRILDIAYRAANSKVNLYRNTTSTLRSTLGEESDAILSLYSIQGSINTDVPPPPTNFILD